MKLIPAPADLDRWLKPGDLLLYRGTSLWSWLIRVKTWSDVSHAEVYRGDGGSYASRDGEGVNVYALRRDGLFAVLRPKWAYNAEKADAWFMVPYDPKTKTGIRGQKYDWWGLLRFFTIGKQSMDKQFCFELATRLYRNSGGDPFDEHYDADLVSGNTFMASPMFEDIWSARDGLPEVLTF